MKNPKAILVDDEHLPRTHLKSLLNKAWPELDIQGEAQNGMKAFQLIEEKKPDVVFLDIKMPGITGIEVAEKIIGSRVVVFVTAYDQFAVEAFDKEAVDYLLKPVIPERLEKTIVRIKKRLANASLSGIVPDSLKKLLSELTTNTPRKYLKWIKAQVGDTIHLIDTSQVYFFKSSEKYTLVVCEHDETVIRKPLIELIKELDPSMFVQIHRNTIVNFEFIDKINISITGRGQLKLIGRSEIHTVSRGYLKQFRQM